MFQKNKKKPFVKNSSKGQSKGLLKALQKVINNQSGSVSYVFLQDRVSDIHSKDVKDMRDIKVKAIMHCRLNSESIKGKTAKDLLDMFYSTKHDLGASHFVVD